MNVRGFFNAVITQNRESLKDYFCDDAVIRWYCSNEAFTVDEYVKANCEYPNSWLSEIERVEEYGNKIVLAARVYPEDESASYHVVSFITLENDRIFSLDEYWSDDGEAPQWRKAMRIGKPIRQLPQN